MNSDHDSTSGRLANHPVVSRDEWIAARTALLKKEKELTHLNDKLVAERQSLPWVKVEKNYVFDSTAGKKTLSELFDGRSQLFIKHFMFSPQWEEGCVGCSFESDHLDATLPHLHHHDVTVVAVSRAPVDKLEAFKKRMGWHFTWVSSGENDFNYDYNVSFTPEQAAAGEVFYNYTMQPYSIDDLSGFSSFYKDEAGQIFHTYSSFGRGAEYLIGTYVVLDMMPKGRNETGPNHNLTDWVRHHDRYDAGGTVNATGQYVKPAGQKSDCGCSNEADQ